jgi:hypothetical protein
MFTSWQAPRVVRTALGAGDTRLASALVERTTSYGLRLPPAVDLARALCTEAAGDVEMARDLFDQARTAFAKLPGLWEHACCLASARSKQRAAARGPRRSSHARWSERRLERACG